MDISGISDKIDLTEGQWVDKIPGLPGVSLHVRSANYKPYTRTRSKVLRDAAPDMDTDEGDAQFWMLAGSTMAEHLLIGWKGLKSGEDEVAFTPKMAVQILTADDPHGIGERFRRGVDWASAQVAEQLAKRTDKLAKN